MAYPKIRYTDLAGAAQGFSFQFPPVQQPAQWLTPDRVDTIATSGVKQSWWLRNDEFLELTMSYVQIGDDLDAWKQFLAYALTGGPFTFYPDADNDALSADYTLEDTDWKAAFQFYRTFGFVLKCRKDVAA